MSARRTRTELARFGEEQAAAWYRRRGFDVLEQNWFCPTTYGRGELDLVLRQSSLVVICEVKTRTSTKFGGGHAAVGWAKQQQVRKLAGVWLHEVARLRDDIGFVELRFDVADVDAEGNVCVYEQAF